MFLISKLRLNFKLVVRCVVGGGCSHMPHEGRLISSKPMIIGSFLLSRSPGSGTPWRVLELGEFLLPLPSQEVGLTVVP